MKKIINIKRLVTILVLMVTVTSCELEPEVFDELSPENFPKSEKDAVASISDIYRGLDEAWCPSGGLDYSHWMLNILCTDELATAWTGNWQLMDRLSWDSNTKVVNDVYNKYAKNITKATITIGNLKNAPISNEELRARLLSEARTLRAFYAFSLMDLYGPVPIITDPEIAVNLLTLDLKPERPTEEWMVNFITTELKESIPNLPIKYADSDYGRITRGAALGILMKLQLHQKNWQGVETTTKDIMNLGYKLMPTYTSIFDYNNEGNSNTEIILVVPKMVAGGLGTSWFACVLPQVPLYKSPPGTEYQIWGGLKTPWSFYDTFEEGKDERLTRMIRYYEDVKGNKVDFRKVSHSRAIGAAPKKYGDDPNHQGAMQGNDIILIRYADVLLARAEALNEISALSGEAQNLVKQIRDRAKAGAIPTEALVSQSTFRDFILAERGRELWCEGHRRQDLIRHGKFISTAEAGGYKPSGNHLLLYPIPQSVRNENPNIGQNPGY